MKKIWYVIRAIPSTIVACLVWNINHAVAGILIAITLMLLLDPWVTEQKFLKIFPKAIIRKMKLWPVVSFLISLASLLIFISMKQSFLTFIAGVIAPMIAWASSMLMSLVLIYKARDNTT